MARHDGSTHDMIVIGGGTAGLVTAAGSAGIGARVALVERERLGGECLWSGCVPSKALIACARAAHDVRGAARFGVDAGEPRVDFARSMAWVHGAIARIAPHDSPERFRGLGVDVVEGTARFTGDRTIDVDGRRMTAPRVVVATGTSPTIPPIEGLAEVPFLTNETIFSLDQLPATLLIIGAGAIGVELAQAFARLGSAVHVVEAGPRVLPHEDHELTALLAERLAAEGIALRMETRVTRVSREGERVRLHVESAGGAATLDGDALLVAVGRTPRVDTLDLARVGIEMHRNGVVVDAGLRTTAPGVWAAGDVVGPLRFTHVADYQARLVIRNAFFPFTSKADYSAVPWVTFTDPELARVGLTEHEARERHGDGVRVWRRPFADVDRAIADGRTQGLTKLVTDAKGRLLGGHILGSGAGNMIGEITLAMKHGIGVGKLGNTTHPYPTYPEAIKQAAEGYYKSRFTGIAKSVAGWFARR
jgi:pyruvate/2-oxoglutarate dehydrogenase complex dihydrolipoamide dehydrogenase (E3) component